MGSAWGAGAAPRRPPRADLALVRISGYCAKSGDDERCMPTLGRRKAKMKRYLIAVAVMVALAAPASAQLSSQQQRMKDCNTQASGMSGDARNL